MPKSKSVFKDANELKEFISWVKAQKVKKFKYDDLEFEVSELAYIDDVVGQTSTQASGAEKATADEDEELLFHSSR